MKGNNLVVVAARIQFQLAVVDQIGRKLGHVDHFGGSGVLKNGSRDRVHRCFQKVGRAVHGIHVLVDDAPHVAALAAQDPFDAQAFGFQIHLGVEPLHGFVGGKGAEVAAFGSIGAPGDVQAVLFLEVMKQHQYPMQV
jgi:hypothetical protein